MDLHTLHARTGISKRKLRYCVDHQLVPELNIELAVDEAGRPRKFNEDVGFGIVCAARLLSLGLRHETIRAFLGGLLQIRVGKDPAKRALVSVLERDVAAQALFADGRYVRLQVEEYPYDSQWIALEQRSKPPKNYEPTVLVTLNLSGIRDQVCGIPFSS